MRSQQCNTVATRNEPIMRFMQFGKLTETKAPLTIAFLEQNNIYVTMNPLLHLRTASICSHNFLPFSNLKLAPIHYCHNPQAKDQTPVITSQPTTDRRRE